MRLMNNGVKWLSTAGIPIEFGIVNFLKTKQKIWLQPWTAGFTDLIAAVFQIRPSHFLI
jgi:hypothetical protein